MKKKRTQIYLTHRQHDYLEGLSEKTELSKSELIRRILDREIYSKYDNKDISKKE